MKIKNKPTNKIIISAVAVFAAALCAALLLMDILKTEGQTANVYSDAVLVQTLDLNTDQKIDIGTNIIEVKNGKIRMQSASCPDKLCVKQGEISCAGESVICLPNKVVIEIDGKTKDIDALSQ